MSFTRRKCFDMSLRSKNFTGISVRVVLILVQLAYNLRFISLAGRAHTHKGFTSQESVKNSTKVPRYPVPGVLIFVKRRVTQSIGFQLLQKVDDLCPSLPRRECEPNWFRSSPSPAELDPGGGSPKFRLTPIPSFPERLPWQAACIARLLKVPLCPEGQ